MTSPLPLLITGGRIVDPSQGFDAVGDILVENGKVAWVLPQGAERPYLFPSYHTLDATGLVVCPGFIDMHTHLREPGLEAKETIATGTEAAARGGFTTVTAMPNTEPALDNRSLIEFIYRKAEVEAVVRVLPIGAITQHRAGRDLAEMHDMADAGAIAFSDDGSPLEDAHLMRQALTYSMGLGLPIIEHADDPALSRGGAMHEGWVSARLGLAGVPAAAEESAVARDISLVRQTGGRLHVAHLSTAGALAMVRQAKADGLPVTAEVTPHHLALNHEWVMGRRSFGGTGEPYDTFAKVNPPLRTPEDTVALLEGLRDGTIDIIATDHAPHTSEDKLVEFADAAVGFSGLETAIGLLLTLVDQGSLDLTTLISSVTHRATALLPERYRDLGSLRAGSAADIAIVDPSAKWVVDPIDFASKGKNTPLAGCSLTGRVMSTVYGGAVVYDALQRARVVTEGAPNA